MVNNSCIYWKWEDQSLTKENIHLKVEDLCKRTEIGAVAIAFHWVKKDIKDSKLLDLIAFATELLHEKNRKIYIEVCPRNEGLSFLKKYPEEVAYLTTKAEILIDENGCGTATADVSSVPHYWRVNNETKITILSSFLVEDTKKIDFSKSTRVFNNVSVANIALNDGVQTATIEAKTDRSNAGKKIVTFIGIPQVIPDLASEQFESFFSEMLNIFKDVELTEFFQTNGVMM